MCLFHCLWCRSMQMHVGVSHRPCQRRLSGLWSRLCGVPIAHASICLWFSFRSLWSPLQDQLTIPGWIVGSSCRFTTTCCEAHAGDLQCPNQAIDATPNRTFACVFLCSSAPCLRYFSSEWSGRLPKCKTHVKPLAVRWRLPGNSQKSDVVGGKHSEEDSAANTNLENHCRDHLMRLV